MSTLALLTTTARTPITLRQFLTEMEAAIARNPWLADAPLRILKSVEDVNGDYVGQSMENITSVSSGVNSATHYIILK